MVPPVRDGQPEQTVPMLLRSLCWSEKDTGQRSGGSALHGSVTGCVSLGASFSSISKMPVMTLGLIAPVPQFCSEVPVSNSARAP